MTVTLLANQSFLCCVSVCVLCMMEQQGKAVTLIQLWPKLWMHSWCSLDIVTADIQNFSINVFSHPNLFVKRCGCKCRMNRYWIGCVIYLFVLMILAQKQLMVWEHLQFICFLGLNHKRERLIDCSSHCLIANEARAGNISHTDWQLLGASLDCHLHGIGVKLTHRALKQTHSNMLTLFPSLN